jgi:glutamate/tyrosine decarboxylase-like PLP-dependent enzyme
VIIVGNAGEVNTGHFDDLSALADLRDAHPGGAWLHVDGAFGLFASRLAAACRAHPWHRTCRFGRRRRSQVAERSL